MFDIGFQELLLIGIVSLLIMGPERLPGAIRKTSLWVAKLRASFRDIKADIEREIGADEIKQQLHNDAIMESLERAGGGLVNGARELQSEFQQLGTEPYGVDTSTADSVNSKQAADLGENNRYHGDSPKL
ncbi:MAG: sec-independent protein translocase protein TatB [Paraglaciecola psychrophila]|jgi:sec-independent protein translocase protein TatB